MDVVSTIPRFIRNGIYHLLCSQVHLLRLPDNKNPRSIFDVLGLHLYASLYQSSILRINIQCSTIKRCLDFPLLLKINHIDATVIYESDNVERIAELAKDADIIIVSVGEPSYQHDPPWGYDTLEITGSQQEILEAAKASGKPMVTVVTGGRPYILTWCDENTNAILEAYYPGSQGGIAIAETLFGLNNPTGKTPLQFPRDMDSVRNQEGDVSFDLENPLYDYGWGLSYGE